MKSKKRTFAFLLALLGVWAYGVAPLRVMQVEDTCVEDLLAQDTLAVSLSDTLLVKDSLPRRLSQLTVDSVRRVYTEDSIRQRVFVISDFIGLFHYQR